MAATREIFERFGYDPDDPVPRDEYGHPIIPDRLLEDLGRAPVLARIPKFPRWGTRPELSRRELAVLVCMSHGMNEGQVGVMLERSKWTVKAHLAACRYKLAASTTVEACCEAVRRGLIS